MTSNAKTLYRYNEVTDKEIEEMQVKIESWAGDFTPEDWSELVAQLLTGAYRLDYLKEDVESYND